MAKAVIKPVQSVTTPKNKPKEGDSRVKPNGMRQVYRNGKWRDVGVVRPTKPGDPGFVSRQTPVLPPATGGGSTSTSPNTRPVTWADIWNDPTMQASVDAGLAPQVTNLFRRMGIAITPSGSQTWASVAQLFNPEAAGGLSPTGRALSVGGRTVSGWGDVSGIETGVPDANTSGLSGTTLSNLIQSAASAAAAGAAGRSSRGVTGGAREAGRRMEQSSAEAGWNAFLTGVMESIAGIGTQRQQGLTGLLQNVIEVPGSGSVVEPTPSPVPPSTPGTSGGTSGGAGGGTGGGASAPSQPWWTSLKPGESGGNQRVPESSRGAYTVPGSPGGKAPAKPEPGMAYKGPSGVLWVYRLQPKPGWYKKSGS